MRILVAITLAFAAANAQFQCPHDYGFFEDPTNCIKFFACVHGEATRATCNIDYEDGVTQLEFDKWDQVCKRPENVFCRGIPICDENDENCEFEPSTAQPPEFECPRPWGYFPNYHDCKAYFQCSDNAVIPHTCHVGALGQTYWAESLMRCDYLENFEGCGTRPL